MAYCLHPIDYSFTRPCAPTKSPLLAYFEAASLSSGGKANYSVANPENPSVKNSTTKARPAPVEGIKDADLDDEAGGVFDKPA